MLLVATGFTDAYTFLRHGHVFAEAMTGNLVLIGVGALRPAIVAFWHPLVAYAAFVLGVMALWLIARRRERADADGFAPQRLVLAFEVAVLAVVGALPGGVPQPLITAVIAFGAGLQSSAFRAVGEAPVSTVVMTTNSMQAMNAVLAALENRDPEDLARARGLLVAIAGFVSGVFLGAGMSVLLGDRAAWVGAGVFTLAAVLHVRLGRADAADPPLGAVSR